VTHVAATPRPDHVRGRRLKHRLALDAKRYLAGILGWITALLVTVGLNGLGDLIRRRRQ